MKIKKIFWPLIITLVVGLLVFQKINQKSEKQNAQGGKPGAKGPVPVKALLIQTKSIPQVIQAGGTLLAEEQTDLKFEINGKISSIHFEDGKPVKKGQLLVKLDDSSLKAQQEKINAQLKLLIDLEKRQKELLGKEGISEIDYLRTSSELDAVKADLKLINEQIRKTELTAPFDGVIGFKNISPGAVVGPETKLASLQKLSRIKVEFNLPEKFAGRIKNGSSVEFTCTGKPEIYRATVYATEPNIDLSTRNLIVRAIVPGNENLYPGSFVNVKIPLATIDNAIMIPTGSIIPVLKGQKVYVAQGDTVVEKMVKTGMRTSGELEITEGLEKGDTLITSALMQLKKGSKIKVVQLK